MDDATKILEVTYGTFSCRLEGFEDSVETMKAVVSYFHDLAGHDRFMDMEPQAPDMDTLTRLTEEQEGAAVDVDVDVTTAAVSLRLRNSEAQEERPSLRKTPTGIHVEEEEPVAEYEAEDAFEDSVAMDEGFDATSDELNDIADEEIDETAEEAQSDPVDLDASFADKLQRIRAVVGRGEARESDDTFAEDLTEPEKAPVALNPLAQRLAELAKRNSELTLLDAQNEAEDDSEEIVADYDDLADDMEEDEVESASELDEAAELHDLDEPEMEDVAEDDTEADEMEDATLDSEMDDMEIAASSEDDDLDDVAETEGNVAAKDFSGPLVLTSRDAATSDDDDLDDYDDDDDDDFDLHAEVAKVEAEIASRPGNQVARHGLPRSVDDAMSRILSQTDQQLNLPESRRHRDAFAQLKAAVAATEAARQLGDPGAKPRDTEDDFKSDLGMHDAEEKAEAQKVTSLKLVTTEAEDNAEAPSPAVVKPLDAASERLRQIASLKEAETAPKTTDFAAFAKAHGAEDLVDLMEAAAAYIAFVEGDEDFSRPQVMKKVQSAVDEEITREDGLRSFGRLLRQARIIKLSNGRFQVAENTQYRPDGDKAAQG